MLQKDFLGPKRVKFRDDIVQTRFCLSDPLSSKRDECPEIREI